MQRKVLRESEGGNGNRISEVTGKQCQTSPQGSKYCIQLQGATPNGRKSFTTQMDCDALNQSIPKRQATQKLIFVHFLTTLAAWL